MAGKRNHAIDIARGIAMYSIVLGHLGQPSINRIVFTYHLPIFYLISGYFFKDQGESYGKFIKYKGRRLLIPYYFTCLILCIIAIFASWRGGDLHQRLLKQVLASLYGAGDRYEQPFKIYSIGAIWFLWATFWGELFLKMALKIKSKLRIVFIFVLFGLSVTTYKIIWLPLSIQAGMCALLFMYVGHLLREYHDEISMVKTVDQVFFVVMAFFMWIYMIKNFKAFWLVHCEIGNGIVDIIGSLCGCSILYLLSKGIDQKIPFVSHFFSFFGRYSLLFLCIHIIELTFFPYAKVYPAFVHATGMTTISLLAFKIMIKMILITLCVVITCRIPLIRKVYGYKK